MLKEYLSLLTLNFIANLSSVNFAFAGTMPSCLFLILFSFFVFFAFSRATPSAYGSSQARGLIGAVAASLNQSHSNAGSEPRLRPTPQLTATPDP